MAFPVHGAKARIFARSSPAGHSSLKVGLGALREQQLPRRFEIDAGLVEAGRGVAL
jgi:hypothetical protein